MCPAEARGNLRGTISIHPRYLLRSQLLRRLTDVSDVSLPPEENYWDSAPECLSCVVWVKDSEEKKRHCYH